MYFSFSLSLSPSLEIAFFQAIPGLVSRDAQSYPALALSETVKSDSSFQSIAITESKRASVLFREGRQGSPPST